MKQWKLNKKYIAISLLIPTGIGIIICMIFSVGLTLARFSTNMVLNTQSIVAGNFDIEVSVYKEVDLTLIEKVNGKYNLEAGTYKIKIKRVGSSINSNGYSSIMIGDVLYDTEPLYSNGTLEFTLAIGQPKEVSFKAVWGDAKADITNIIKNNDIISIGVENLVENPADIEINNESVNPENKNLNDDNKVQSGETSLENEVKSNG